VLFRSPKPQTPNPKPQTPNPKPLHLRGERKVYNTCSIYFSGKEGSPQSVQLPEKLRQPLRAREPDAAGRAERRRDKDRLPEPLRSHGPIVSQRVNSFDDKKIKQLIDYIINEPASDASDKEGHKYPFVSHEILKTQSQIIIDHFFPSLDPKRKASTNSKGTGR